MKVVLFYMEGDEYEQAATQQVFNTKDEMINFVNDKGIGKDILVCYEVLREIKIEPYQKVTQYKISD